MIAGAATEAASVAVVNVLLVMERIFSSPQTVARMPGCDPGNRSGVHFL
jgi:hypothetical protein